MNAKLWGKIFVLVFAVFLLSNAYAVLEQGSLDLFAVTDSGQAMTAKLTLTITPGSGKIWSSVHPLVGTSTQNTEKISVELAKNYFGDVEKYDYLFEIESTASLVEGPSAGAAMALLTISMLEDKTIPQDVGLTGTINSDGTVGAVGGVFEKSKEASNIGKKLFMIPRGEARQIVKLDTGIQSINLVEYGAENWGLKIVEVDTIDDVITYAFTDISKIDVNKELLSVPEFVPEPVKREPQLDVMYSLTRSYIEKADSKIIEAKNAVSGTLIQDQSLVSSLYETLNVGEEALSESKLLIDQNYLYSAANSSFLAYVDASIVLDIAANPSLLTLDSEVYSKKVDELVEKLESLKSDLSGNIPVDYLEWHIAAQQRLSYAENAINKIKNTEVIVIGGDSDAMAALEKISEYEYAAAWYEVAYDFYGISKSSRKKVRPDDNFKELASSYMTKAENALVVLTEEEIGDMQRRADSAKTQLNGGWYLGSVFDSTAAYSLAQAELEIKGKSVDELLKLLDEKISETEGKMLKNKSHYIWARLYIDHAKYFRKSADFYKKYNLGARALESARSGLSLAYLANELVLPSADIYSYYEKIGPENYIVEKEASAGQETEQKTPYFLILILLGTLLAVLMVILIIVKFIYPVRMAEAQSLEMQINNIRKTQANLDASFEKKKIDANTYHNLKEKYQQQIDELLTERIKRSHKIVEFDNLNSKLHSYREAVGELNRHYKDGLIIKEDYDRNLNFYNEAISYLESQIETAKKEIKPKKFGILSGKKPETKKSLFKKSPKGLKEN